MPAHLRWVLQLVGIADQTHPLVERFEPATVARLVEVGAIE